MVVIATLGLISAIAVLSLLNGVREWKQRRLLDVEISESGFFLRKSRCSREALK
jgi:hypothetical protein